VHTEDPYVFEALAAGLVGYVVKTQVAVDLVEALREVLQGMISVRPRVAGAVVQASRTTADLPLDPLTSREFEIVQRLAEGQTTKAIAYRLGLRVKTVESHRLHLMRKLDMHETATRVRYAIRQGLILP
jgi:DNA-binding NarL/FixJ family response regulator